MYINVHVHMMERRLVARPQVLARCRKGCLKPAKARLNT